jgi:hypothetical protein
MPGHPLTHPSLVAVAELFHCVELPGLSVTAPHHRIAVTNPDPPENLVLILKRPAFNVGQSVFNVAALARKFSLPVTGKYGTTAARVGGGS